MGLKDKHEPNEVAYGAGQTMPDLHPGEPSREVKTGKVNDGAKSDSFYPTEPTVRERAMIGDAVDAKKEEGKAGSPKV